jgi:hypothetical protein
MRKRKAEKSARGQSKEEKRLQAVYAKSRREFSARDLQKFTVMEPGVPLKTIIAAMERIQIGGKARKA